MPRSTYLEFLKIALHASCHGGHRWSSFFTEGIGLELILLAMSEIQVLVTSFSRTSPILLLADLPEIKDIAVKELMRSGDQSCSHTDFEVAVPSATPCTQSTNAFNRQERLWNLHSQSRVPGKRCKSKF
jgi:hypothetical protein